MTRIIQTDGVGKQRNKLTKMIVISIRELMQQQKPNDTTRDLAAFIAFALAGVAETIERTVAPWEKRDYWVKADKFRMEWEWSEKLAEDMRIAALDQNWGDVAMLAARVGENLKKVEVSPKHRMGKPWVGAWDKLKSQ